MQIGIDFKEVVIAKNVVWTDAIDLTGTEI